MSIQIRKDSDVMVASMQARKMAEKLGMKSVESTLCATAISELATNIIRYAGKGEIRLRQVEGAFYAEAVDQGPGIVDVDQAMQEGHSGGKGLGMGLSGVERIMDKLEIQTEPGKGTRVRVSKLSRRARTGIVRDPGIAKVVDDAYSLKPCPGESVSGDGALIVEQLPWRYLALWDIAGHGMEAHELSKTVDDFIRSCLSKTPAVILQDIHDRFRGSRGLVAVIARLDPVTGVLEYAGIGNVSLLHVHQNSLKRLPLQEGVIGYQIRTPENRRLLLKPGDSLVMHSDGIRSINNRLDMNSGMTAIQILNQIMRRFPALQADDAGCLVLRYRRLQ